MRSITAVILLVAAGCLAEHPQWTSTLEYADHSQVRLAGPCAETANDPGVIACSEHARYPSQSPAAGTVIGTIAGLGGLVLLGLIGAAANAPVH